MTQSQYDAYSLLEELYNLTWEIAEHFCVTEESNISDGKFTPKPDAPIDLLKKLIRCNTLTAIALHTMREPVDNIPDDELEAEEIELTQEMYNEFKSNLEKE